MEWPTFTGPFGLVFLYRSHAVPGCPEDPSPQIAHLAIGFAPVDAVPVGRCRWSVCTVVMHLTFPSMSVLSEGSRTNHQIHVSTLSGWVLPYPAGYGFPLPFGCWRSLLGSSCAHWRIPPSLRVAY